MLTGSEKAFAAGADIKEMQAQGFADMYSSNFFAGWEQVTATRKPWIAAVAGFALGGGCEVAMMADFIIAADSAKFGQPEIKLGVTPGMGGSQRLTWAIGKAKAMEMCLTGRMMDAAEAERSGLVAKVVPAADLIDEALKTAETIAAMPPLAAIAVKEMVNAAFEIPLGQGIPSSGGCSTAVRHRGPEGRHGRLRREAAGELEGALSMARIAFIGLGHMGGGMAPNLAKAGHDVRAFDLVEEAVEKARQGGCTRGGLGGRRGQGRRRGHHHASRRAACPRCLPRRRRAQCQARRAADRLLDHRRRQRARGRRGDAGAGLRFRRCAGVGRDRRRGRRTLTFMVGGSDDAFERARPFLEPMAKAVIHAGELGAGQAAKICNNMILGATMAATCEAFVLAQKLGLDLADLLRHFVESVGPELVDDQLLRRCPASAPTRRPTMIMKAGSPRR